MLKRCRCINVAQNEGVIQERVGMLSDARPLIKRSKPRLTAISFIRVILFGRFVLRPSFWLGHQHFTTEFEFPCFVVYSDQFHLYGIPFIKDAFHGLQALPADFTDMQQALLSGKEFDESSIG